MAESKRLGGKPRKRGGKRIERLTPLDFALNAVAALGAAPALIVGGTILLLFPDRFGGADLNQPMFLGLVAYLVAIFLVLLSGLKLYEHVRARRRFNELIAGGQKSAIMQHIDELGDLARALGPPYRQRLEARLGEMGIKR